MKEFGKMILAIEPKVKDFIAKQFIADASLRHAIAFFQWRLHFCKNNFSDAAKTRRANDTELKAIVDSRVGGLEFKAFLATQRLNEYQEAQQHIYKKQQQFNLDHKKIQQYCGEANAKQLPGQD